MTAIFSDDMRYRYRLERRLGDQGKTAGVVMVNPSIATGEKDDPTIRKLLGFGAANGWRRIIVTNLFAHVATDVRELRRATDPIGPDNDRHIADMLLEADLVLVAWGPLAKLPEALRGRWKDIPRMTGRTLHCLGVAQDGQPRHPLMVSYKIEPEPWTVPWLPFARPAT